MSASEKDLPVQRPFFAWIYGYGYVLYKMVWKYLVKWSLIWQGFQDWTNQKLLDIIISPRLCSFNCQKQIVWTFCKIFSPFEECNTPFLRVAMAFCCLCLCLSEKEGEAIIFATILPISLYFSCFLWLLCYGVI